MDEYVRARELWLEQQLAALPQEDRDLLGQATKLLDQLAAYQPVPSSRLTAAAREPPNRERATGGRYMSMPPLTPQTWPVM